MDGEIHELPSPKAAPQLKKTFAHNIEAIVDRIVLKPEIRSRLADSIEIMARSCRRGWRLWQSRMSSDALPGGWADNVFQQQFACLLHPEVFRCWDRPASWSELLNFSRTARVRLVSGWGRRANWDPELVVPDESVSLEKGAVEAWRKNGKRMNIHYSRILRQFCRDFGVGYSNAVQGHAKESPGKS